MLMLKIYFALFVFSGGPISAFTLHDDDPLEEALADCVLNISRTYFNQDLPTVIQTPETWRKYGVPIKTYKDTFFEIFSSRSDFPQAPIGYITANLSVPQLKVMLPGSYIMKIPRGLNKQTHAWIIQMLRRMDVNIYNPKARLVIVVNWYPVGNVFSMVGVLLEWSYEFAFSDAIVVVPRRGKSNKLTNLDVFGWLPEDERNICLLQVNVIRRFNTWLVDKKSFAYKRHLFPVKTMRNKYHCYIKAYHGHLPPYVYYDKGRVVGSMVELVNYAVALVSVEHAMKKKHDPVHSILLPLTIEPTHELSICKLTYPLFNVDHTWYVPVGHKVAPWRSLYKAFHPLMWICVLITSTFGNIFLWLIQKIKQLRFGMKDNIDNSLLVIFILMHLNIGVRDSYTGPASVLLFSLLLFYSFLINTAYQSTLFGLMVEPGEYPPIKTLEELKASNLGLKTNEKQLIYGDNDVRYINTYGNYSPCGIDCVLEMSENSDFAVLFSKNSGEAMRGKSREKHGSYKIVSLTEIDHTYYNAIGSDQSNCLVLKKLETLVFRAASSGLLQKWNDEYILLWKRDNYPHFEETRVSALSLWHVQGAFYVLVVGLLCSVFTFVVEILLYASSID
ncbi:Ionotropic receptor 388 [Blattella germanica]|nr:Ionotropic receptor 388 [Blattella germanica]